MAYSAALCVLLAVSASAAETFTLEECIERALKQNNQMQLASQAIRRSEADVKSARANRLPRVNATLLNFTRSRTGPSVRVQENPTGAFDSVTGQRIFREEATQIPAIDRHSFSMSGSVNQSLYDGGNRRHSHHAARHALQSVRTSFEAQRATTVFSVQQRYFALLKAQDLVEVQREALKLSEKQLEEATLRLEVGAGVRGDVLRLQVTVGNAQANMINAEQGVVLSRANLNYIMGQPISKPLSAVEAEQESFALGGVTLEELLRRAETANPEIRRLEASQIAAAHNLSAAKAAWYPNLNGSVSYSRNNEVFDRVYQAFDKNYRLNAGVTLSYNVFDGGLRSASIDRSRIALENARLNLEQQKREIALAVETAYLELLRLNKILEISGGTLAVAEEDLKLAEQSYRIGQGTLLELLDAQVGFTQARSDQVRARHDLAIAQAEVERLADVTVKN